MKTIVTFYNDFGSNPEEVLKNLKEHCNCSYCPVGLFPCPFNDCSHIKCCEDITMKDWKNIVKFSEE